MTIASALLTPPGASRWLEERGAAAEGREQALWLTAEEATLLITLCFTSHASGGDREDALFGKLGNLARSFSMWPQGGAVASANDG